MQRIALPTRADWREKVESYGLIWQRAGGQPYWNEAAYYLFTPSQIAQIETATAELYRLFLAAGDHIVAHDLFEAFDIPEWCVPAIRKAWEDEPPALNYGRFDLGYDGHGQPKLFEFNCDTPTSLLEAAVIQWDWKEEIFPGADQFNSLHEALVAKWEDLGPHLSGSTVHFAHVRDEAGEDAVTTAYLADTARKAGLVARLLPMNDIGWDGAGFVDEAGGPIETLYKLYPWEWLVREPFGQNILHARTRWIEPIWKMIWSNKAVLKVLWDLFPDHPNLLRASFERPTGAESYAAKPVLAREGANVRLFRAGEPVAESGGSYGAGNYVYQALYDLPDFGGRYPVIGSWVVDGRPAGMGIREDGLITGNTAQFVPHVMGRL